MFGGAVIAQRNTSSGAVTFLIGDHLGSVSATTNLSGVRQSVQYFDPWGKIRSGNVQASTFSYTGQRRDDTGLLYDNARYYDPARGQFVSADSMVADLSNPATLNRYAYGFNNPLRYTDPSGHCNVDGTDGDDPNECEKRLSQLTDYNVSVINYHLGAWSLVELDIVLEALGAMLKAFNWSLKKFHEKIGDVFIEQISDRSTPAIGGKQSPAVAWPSLTGTHIIFAQDAFGSRPGVLNKDYFKRTVIHEFAHAWDFNAKLFNSSRIAKYAGLQDHYGRDHYTTPYGETRRQEDWAESVSETVMNTNGVDAGRKALVNRIAQE